MSLGKLTRLLLPLFVVFGVLAFGSAASAATPACASGVTNDAYNPATGLFYPNCPVASAGLNRAKQDTITAAVGAIPTPSAGTLTYTPNLAGGVPQDAQQPFDATVRIEQFLTKPQDDAIKSCTATFDMTPILAQAVAAVTINTSDYTLGHGKVTFHRGCYVYFGNQDEHGTVILEGESSGLASGGSTIFQFPTLTGASAFTFENSGTVQCAPSGSGASSAGITLRNITIFGPGGSIDPTGTVNAFLACAQFDLENVNIRMIPGDDVQVLSTNSIIAGGWRISGGDWNGNAGNSRYGVYLSGPNANTGQMVGTLITDHGGSAVYDPDSVGMNKFDSITSESNGRSVAMTLANQSGASFRCLDPTLCASTSPTGNPSVWAPIAFNASYPSYSSAIPYIDGAPFSALTAGARNVFFNGYSEGSDPPSDVRYSNVAEFGNLLIGGAGVTSFSTATGVFNGDGNFIVSQTGYGGMTQTPSGGFGVEAIVGGGTYANGDVIRSQNSGVGTGNYRKHWIGAGCDLYDDWDNQASERTEIQSGDCTTLQFGRGSAQPNQIAFPEGFFLSQGQDNGNARWVGECTAMPTSGTFATGDRCFNSAPSELGTTSSKYVITGWIRITTGSGNVLNTDWLQMRTLTGN